MQLARLVRPHRRRLRRQDRRGGARAAHRGVALEARDPRAVREPRAVRAGVRGIDAASRFWFDKPPARALARRGRDARGHPARARASTHRQAPGARPPAARPDPRPDGGGRAGLRRDEARARRAPSRWWRGRKGRLRRAAPRRGRSWREARALAGASSARRRGAADAQRSRRRSSRDLQREVELAAREQSCGARRAGTSTAAAVVVLENATGEVLAYVGSPDFGDDARGGQNDGVRALRQPGSTLKPFVYGLAMERLGWTAATVAARRRAARRRSRTACTRR